MIVIPNNEDLKQMILEEGHKSGYSFHPGITKMHQDLKKMFWSGDERGHRSFCSQMPRLSANKDRTSKKKKPLGKVATPRNPQMEIGECGNGFCNRVTQDPTRF
jgi:hypothetical protein